MHNDKEVLAYLKRLKKQQGKLHPRHEARLKELTAAAKKKAAAAKKKKAAAAKKKKSKSKS